MKLAHRLVVWWAYAIEIVFSAATVAALLMRFGKDEVAQFAVDRSVAFVTVAALFLTFTGAMLAIAINLLSAQFGKWMRVQRADRVFVNGLWYSIFVQIANVIFQLVVFGLPKGWIRVVGMFIFAYAATTTISSASSMRSLWLLKPSFAELVDRESCQEDEQSRL